MPYTFSKTGTHHLEHREENQDAVSFKEDGRYAVITLADGVSSCPNSREGAEIAAREMTRLLFLKAPHFLSFPEETIAELSLAHIRWELKKKAEELNIEIDELSSTLCSALYDKKTKRLLLVNLGDGLIITVGKNGCSLPVMPYDSRNGCVATTTPKAEKHMTVRKMAGDQLKSVYICSDGAWRSLFSRNTMKQEVREILQSNHKDRLGNYLDQNEHFDDCTFVSMDLKRKYERKPA